MKYKITTVFESYWDVEVDADDLDQALKVANGNKEWEEDYDYRPCVKGYWAIVDEEGEAEDAGELTPEQLSYLQQ